MDGLDRFRKSRPQRDSIPGSLWLRESLYRLSYPGSQTYIYIYIYLWTLTLLSRTSPDSVHKTATEPIQPNTATHYHRRLLWTATNIRRYQTDTHFKSSPSEAKHRLSPVVAVWMCLVVRWRGWKGRGGIDIAGVGKGLSNLIDRMTSRILPLHKVKPHVNRSISQFALTYHLSLFCSQLQKSQAICRPTLLSSYCRWL